MILPKFALVNSTTFPPPANENEENKNNKNKTTIYICLFFILTLYKTIVNLLLIVLQGKNFNKEKAENINIIKYFYIN